MIDWHYHNVLSITIIFVIVMESGKIVEQGSHSELLEKKGYYSKLYNIQFVQKQAS